MRPWSLTPVGIARIGVFMLLPVVAYFEYGIFPAAAVAFIAVQVEILFFVFAHVWNRVALCFRRVDHLEERFIRRSNDPDLLKSQMKVSDQESGE